MVREAQVGWPYVACDIPGGTVKPAWLKRSPAERGLHDGGHDNNQKSRWKTST